MPPTAPKPTIPSVLPGISIPTKCFLPSSTTTDSAASSPTKPPTNFMAGPILRAAIKMPANTSSFTALALAPGVLNTTTPRLLISAIGILLVPAPARPMACTLAGISMSCILAERTKIASGVAASLPTS